MVTVASFGAALLYLLPVIVVLICRARKDRALWAVALDIPLAVACDLLLVLAMSRLVTVEIATFASRVVWIALGLTWLRRRRVRGDAPALPPTLRGRALGAVATAGVIATGISMLCSRPYSIWDRKLHTPLTASLRGQIIPFENSHAKGEVLHYHFSGNVIAAMGQALSFDVIHSSLALSITHDLLFGLIGVTVGLLFAELEGGAALGVAATVATLLAGPFTLVRDGARNSSDGYNLLNYLSMSFRPHDAVAGLFTVGVVGALAARAWDSRARLADTTPVLLASVAGLAVSDETSLGVLGLAIGVTWFAFPSIIHPTRKGGALVMAGLLAAFVLPNLAFSGALSFGAQHHALAIVPWRSPGCYMPTLPLSNPRGRALLLGDIGPTLLLWVGTVLGAIATRRDRSRAFAMLGSALLLVSILGLTRVDVDHDAVESHRFFAGEIFTAPLLAFLSLARPRSEEAPAGGARRFLLAGAVACALGALLGALSTVDWIATVLPRRGHRQNHFFTSEDLYALDCRRDMGATFGSRARPIYLSKDIWYAYAGCQPSFPPAKRENAQWTMTIGNPYFGVEAVRVLRKMLGPDEPLTVICQRSSGAARERTPKPSDDPVCAYATRVAPCEDLGERLTRCRLDAGQQAEITR